MNKGWVLGENRVEGQNKHPLSPCLWGHVLIGSVASWQVSRPLRKEFNSIQKNFFVLNIKSQGSAFTQNILKFTE